MLQVSVITFQKKIDKTNILQLAGLRLSIPSSLRHKDCLPPIHFPTKLYKMGFRTNDLCSFCKSQSESLNHLFFHCPYSKQFWNDLEIYCCSVSSKKIRLSLQNVLIGIIAENADPLHLLLNYFIMIGKVFWWNCRNNQILPNIYEFRAKIPAKYETEKIISRKDFFEKKWILSPYPS